MQDSSIKTPEAAQPSKNDEEQDDSQTWQALPVGSEHIIRSLAAEHIVHQLLNSIQQRENVRHDVIFRIVTEFPGVCHSLMEFVWEDGTSVRSLLPLHMVVCLKPPLKTVRAVYEANPDAIFVKESYKEALPFALACSFEASLDVVQFLYEKNQNAIATPRKDGVLPIHLACGFYLGDPSIVNYLVDQNPESATAICSITRWSPLHSACHGGVPDTALLERLLDLDTSMINQPDTHGRTPLQLAARSKHGNSKTLDFLLRASPPNLRGLENFGEWEPLFLVATHQNESTIASFLDMLLTEFLPGRDVITNATRGGASILHWAAIFNSASVVDYLATRFPEMLSNSDEQKDTPLSCGVANGAPNENIRVLIRHYPRGLLFKNAEGERPVDIAKRQRVRKDIIDLLEQETTKFALRIVS